jgi:hypothetical protein
MVKDLEKAGTPAFGLECNPRRAQARRRLVESVEGERAAFGPPFFVWLKMYAI